MMSGSCDERNPVEILADEFLARERRGERPSLTEYVVRYPELAAEIHELIPVRLDMGDARLGVENPAEAVADLTPNCARLARFRQQCGLDLGDPSRSPTPRPCLRAPLGSTGRRSRA
jgi:hypothetical protein